MTSTCAARRDPETLLGGNDPLTLEEIQREPDLCLQHRGGECCEAAFHETSREPGVKSQRGAVDLDYAALFAALQCLQRPTRRAWVDVVSKCYHVTTSADPKKFL